MGANTGNSCIFDKSKLINGFLKAMNASLKQTLNMDEFAFRVCCCYPDYLRNFHN